MSIVTTREEPGRYRVDKEDGRSFWINRDVYESEDRRWLVQDGEHLTSATILSFHRTLEEAKAWIDALPPVEPEPEPVEES
jgi:hypothetical protein